MIAHFPCPILHTDAGLAGRFLARYAGVAMTTSAVGIVPIMRYTSKVWTIIVGLSLRLRQTSTRSAAGGVETLIRFAPPLSACDRSYIIPRFAIQAIVTSVRELASPHHEAGLAHGLVAGGSPQTFPGEGLSRALGNVMWSGVQTCGRVQSWERNSLSYATCFPTRRRYGTT